MYQSRSELPINSAMALILLEKRCYYASQFEVVNPELLLRNFHMTYPEAVISVVLFRVFLWVVFGLSGGLIAAKKGYSPTLGIILGAIFGPFAILVGLILPRTKEARAMWEDEVRIMAELKAARKNKKCPHCGAIHSVVNQFCPSCIHDYGKQQAGNAGSILT